MKEQNIIDVVAAFMNGQKIESTIDGKTWHTVFNPTWNFDCREYRIKPEPERIPYDANDFFGMMLRNEDILNKNAVGVKAKIIWVSTYSVKLHFDYTSIRHSVITKTFYDVIDSYTHLDGSPLTKLK